MKDRFCECTGKYCGEKHKGTCGKPPYSWSQEHGDKCLCIGCYEEWLPQRDFLKAIATIQVLSPEHKKMLKEALS